MVGDDQRVAESGQSCTARYRRSRIVRVPRHTINMQVQHDDFLPDHWVVTWGDDSGLEQAPRCALSDYLPLRESWCLPAVEECVVPEPTDTTFC